MNTMVNEDQNLNLPRSGAGHLLVLEGLDANANVCGSCWQRFATMSISTGSVVHLFSSACTAKYSSCEPCSSSLADSLSELSLDSRRASVAGGASWSFRGCSVDNAKFAKY